MMNLGGNICAILKKKDQWKIPPELVLNSDQTPSSYVSVSKSTMAGNGASSGVN